MGTKAHSSGYARARMECVEPVAEDDMVAAFLRAEMESRRHVKYLLPTIAESIFRRRLVLKPDLADERENELRRQLLAYRGYPLNAVLFHGYPDGAVEWHRERMSIEELGRAK
jgi:hypothetical protein